MTSPSNFDARQAADAVLAVLASRNTPQPGSFTRALIEAMQRADRPNLAILTGAYPELGKAVYMYTQQEDGYAKLCALSGVPVLD